ncbi:MAG TPA: DUF1385 domain-containing protein [Chloroflexota bacterium]|jgi:uncharacterized protein YqhQ|nr:DUF1385 domain-containing protein [Chloroflexota bacterium]
MNIYGGQAVIEGVMMRGRRNMAVACRAPAGQIVLHTEPLDGAVYRSRWARLPFLRGAVMIWDTMALGIRALMFAANVASVEGDQDPADATMPGAAVWSTMVVAIGTAIGIFFVLPVLAMGWLDQFIASDVVSNVVEKVIRLSLILGYMWGIGRLSEIKRVFQYHGAEHKTINAYEAGAPLTPESVKRFPLEHPRCGTTFLIIVVLISFVVFSLLGRPPIEIRIASRILLVPVIAGIAYEFIKWAGARYHTSAFVRTLMAPGLAVQGLTTREPDLAQIEVAIAALRPILEAEEPVVEQEPEPTLEPAIAS